MYKVIGESIKSAISIKLGEIFGTDTIRYKESVTNLQYPNFFIYQISASAEPDTKNKVNLNYIINIRYRYVQDTQTITDLEQKLDEVALKLLTEFTTIKLGRIVRVTDRRYEKVDGVLQFFCNIPLRIEYELTEEQKMQLLKLNENLKKEDI